MHKFTNLYHFPFRSIAKPSLREIIETENQPLESASKSVKVNVVLESNCIHNIGHADSSFLLYVVICA